MITYRPRSGLSAPRRRLPATHHAGHAPILALRGSQSPLNRLLHRIPPRTPQTTVTARKAPTMRLRLHGTAPEIAATLAALAKVLEIRTVSRPYPNRPPSALARVYLDAVPPIRPTGRLRRVDRCPERTT
jgi:hypothetical protein